MGDYVVVVGSYLGGIERVVGPFWGEHAADEWVENNQDNLSGFSVKVCYLEKDRSTT